MELVSMLSSMPSRDELLSLPKSSTPSDELYPMHGVKGRLVR